MSRISWGSSGARTVESGVDRGVFYPQSGPGVPWNGLVNVKEDSEGSNMAPYFVDGVRHNARKTKDSFAAVLQAYTCPIEFEAYDGSSGQQRRRAFGLSYRTKISTAENPDYGHKIHLVYNALAMPTAVNNSTLAAGGLNATPFSWGISTTPIPIPGAQPAAHLIIDTSIAYPEAIAALEDVLYGSESTDPRLPNPPELINLFEQHAILVIIDHGDGTWTAIGPDDVVYMTDPDTFEINWPSVVYLDEDTYQVSSL